ncbi:hypothetical protein evm_015514 [Chilo suppressalis]|nr:hypothetical protein evm_015514 [Chilo suppressalis]
MSLKTTKELPCSSLLFLLQRNKVQFIDGSACRPGLDLRFVQIERIGHVSAVGDAELLLAAELAHEVLTCVSLRLGASATSPRSATLRYFWQRNLRSRYAS